MYVCPQKKCSPYGKTFYQILWGWINVKATLIPVRRGRLKKNKKRKENTYQEMAHCTDLNLPINVQTIEPLFQVTPAQTKPKFVWIIGNLLRDKLANQGVGSATLPCEEWCFTRVPTGEVELRTNLVRAELRAVFYLICFCFRFLIAQL